MPVPSTNIRVDSFESYSGVGGAHGLADEAYTRETRYRAFYIREDSIGGTTAMSAGSWSASSSDVARTIALGGTAT